MAILSRVLQKIFASSAGATETGVIGSEDAGSPATASNLLTIQSLAQYLSGMYAITNGGTGLPKIEDFNSLFLLITSQLAYGFQSGIPEWEGTTPYFNLISFCQENGIIYQSIAGTSGTPNTGNDPATSPSFWQPVLETVMKTISDSIINVGLTATVASNALTIGMTQANGSALSAIAKAIIAFRGTTLTAGTWAAITAIANLSLVVPSGATLGQVAAVPGYLYVYAINNAGAIELAVSGTDCWADDTLQTTTAISAGATSATVLYSTTARTNVAIRFIGTILATEATAGTWATAPTKVSVWPCARNLTPIIVTNNAALTGSLSADLVNSNFSLVLPVAGVWDITIHATVTSTSAADSEQIAIWDATNSVDIGIRSAIGVPGAVGISMSLETSCRVIAGAVTLRIKLYRNGGSIPGFLGGSALTHAHKIEAHFVHK
jgi:hypothetical protein